jgi:hypothetical protein
MSKERAIDAAREYKKRLLEEVRKRGEPSQPAGVRQHRCERYIYLSLNTGENARQQRKAVFDHWKKLAQKEGELPAGLRDQECMVTLPNGEVFCDFCVVRFPALVTETEEEMIPRVELGAALFREFAAINGRLTATFEDQSTFVCEDGRRFPLTSCTWRNLSDADFVSAKSKPARGRLLDKKRNISQ